MKREITSVCMAVLLAAIAAGCSGDEMAIAGWVDGKAKTITESRGDGESAAREDKSHKAKSIALGITRGELIAKLGAPDASVLSRNRGYELLVYKTTLPYSSNLLITVDAQGLRVLIISHGEDWPEDRRLIGFENLEVVWDYETRIELE